MSQGLQPCTGTKDEQHCWTFSDYQPMMEGCSAEVCKHCGATRWAYKQPDRYVYR